MEYKIGLSIDYKVGESGVADDWKVTLSEPTPVTILLLGAIHLIFLAKENLPQDLHGEILETVRRAVEFGKTVPTDQGEGE